MTDEGLTVRLDGTRGRASTDSGKSIDLSPVLVAQIRRLLAEDRAEWMRSRVTAAAAASLAEALTAKPTEDGPEMGEPIATEPSTGQITLPDPPLTVLSQTLRSRISERRFGPCTLAQLSAVVSCAYEVLAVGSTPDGATITHRPVPSAGARHPFTLILLSHQVDALAPGLWEFDPFERKLRSWESSAVSPRAVLEAVCEAGNLDRPPAAVILPLCEPTRTLHRYPAGVTLTWRDAGALHLLLHLCAHDAGLASCILGTSGLLASAGLDGGRQDMGGVAIGSRI